MSALVSGTKLLQVLHLCSISLPESNIPVSTISDVSAISYISLFSLLASLESWRKYLNKKFKWEFW